MNALDIARYFLCKDRDGSLFNKNLMAGDNNRKFYSGNARLNKFLHLAQNIYYAKYDELLFNDKLIAYDNGAVVPSVLENYANLLVDKCDVELDERRKEFLDKFYEAFKNADVKELIELSHEDDAWREKSKQYYTQDEVMETEKYLSRYKEQYSGVIMVMDRMCLNG